MTEKKKKVILSAIDKMEAESLLRSQENRKTRVIEKHVIKKEIQEVEMTKAELAQEQEDLKAYDRRTNTIVYSLGSIICMMVVWNLNSDQRTTLIEYLVYFVLVAGIIAAKKK
jgi:hypothetical protein